MSEVWGPMEPATAGLPPEVRPAVTLLRASIATTIAVLPVYLLGALAVFVRGELHFSDTLLGASVSIWYLVSAASSVWGGRLAERMGANRAMMTAAVGSATSLLGIALLAHRWWELLPFLVVGAVANAIAHPTANLALARGVPMRRMGVAFGAKQSAVPMAAFLGGFTVPVIGLTLGWRWAFVGAAALALLFLLSLPKTPLRTPIPPRRGRAGDVSVPPLVLLGVAASLAVVATNPLAIFYVESAIAQGFSTSLAGTALAVGSVIAMVLRVAWGWLADHRRGSRLALVSMLAASGAVGFVLLGRSSSVWILAAATVLAFGAGWGWAGLLQFAVVSVNPGAPAEATGIVLSFMRIGGTFGPLLIGALAERTTWGFTWDVGAALLVTSAVTVQLARLMIRKDMRKRAGAAAPEEGLGSGA